MFLGLQTVMTRYADPSGEAVAACHKGDDAPAFGLERDIGVFLRKFTAKIPLQFPDK